MKAAIKKIRMLALFRPVPYLLWVGSRFNKARILSGPGRRERSRVIARGFMAGGTGFQAERMGNGFQFLDIILFAAIAAFFVLRLRGVLGKRTGHQKPSRFDPFAKRKPEEKEEDKVIPLPDRSKAGQADAPEEAPAAEASPLEAGLTQIKLADRSFDEERFLAGARAAFEMIVATFAAGDAKALRPLLANDVYADFSGAIEERKASGQTLETTLVGIAEASIIEAELQARTAFVTVKFVSEQVNIVRDPRGEVLEGDTNVVTKITDIWTFARNTRSRDPNWTLVATRSPN